MSDENQPITLLMYAIAKRAKEYADLTIDQLRGCYPETTDTENELVRHCRSMKYSRGDLIEAILVDEFEDDAMSLDLKFGGGPDGED